MSQDTATSHTTPPPQPINKPRRCRYIKTAGDQCRAKAMTGNHYCYSHKYNRRPTFAGVKGYDRVAFLEDAASIQLMLSQVMQGVLDQTFDHHAARTMFYGCQVASGLVRLDMLNQRWLAENKQTSPEQVSETTKSENSEPLGVDEEYRGPTGTFDPQWSFSKYLYEQQCEEMGQPKPTCAADFPASGWLTEDEVKEDPEQFIKRYQARKLKLYEEAQAAKKASGEQSAQCPTGELATKDCHPEPSAQRAVEGPATKDCHPERSAQRAVEGPAFSSVPHSPAKPCPCGGLYAGDPCDDCLARQQRNAPPAQHRLPASLDLKAAADPSTAEPCTLHPVPCTPHSCHPPSCNPPSCCLPFQVPKEKRYCPTRSKQGPSGNNPSPRGTAQVIIAELRRLLLSGYAKSLPSFSQMTLSGDTALDECVEALARVHKSSGVTESQTKNAPAPGGTRCGSVSG
jgi:hypothetical protein